MSTHKANPPRSRKPQTHNNLINSCPQNLDQSKFCVDLKKFNYLTFHFLKPKKSTDRLPKVHGYSSTSVIFTSGPITQCNSMWPVSPAVKDNSLTLTIEFEIFHLVHQAQWFVDKDDLFFRSFGVSSIK